MKRNENVDVQHSFVKRQRMSWTYDRRLKQTAIKMIEDMTLPEIMSFIKRRLGKISRRKKPEVSSDNINLLLRK